MKDFRVILLLSFSLFACKDHNKNQVAVPASENLKVEKITDHVYRHISYLQTNSFGKVSCNGMVVFDGNEAVVFDTPANITATKELIDWIENDLHCVIKAIVPTHFHDDCLARPRCFSPAPGTLLQHF